MDRRKFLKSTSSIALTVPFTQVASAFTATSSIRINLSDVRDYIYNYYDKLLDKDGPYGCYREEKGGRTTLFASVEAAMRRTIIGEDLQISLTKKQRQQWIDLINSYAYQPYGKTPDGSYSDGFYSRNKNGHFLWMNSKIIAALGILGGKQKFPVTFYNEFNTKEKLIDWLERYNWKWQFLSAHFFQGGITYYSFSKKCSSEWRESVFIWLNNNLDEKTGFWTKGLKPGNHYQQLGGSALLLPLYQHHNRIFPYPERLIDSILNFQFPSGRWFNVKHRHDMNFLEYDVLYTLHYLSSLVPNYRKDDIKRAVQKYSDLVLKFWPNRGETFKLDKWFMGIFAILQKMNPDKFYDDVTWTDRFGDKRFFQTDKVEVF